MIRFILFTLLFFPGHLKAQEWINFNNDSILFTAKYPSTWVNKIKEGKRVFFTSPSENAKDDFLENVNISVSTNPDFGTRYKIQDLFPDILEQLKQSFTEFNDEGLNNFKWNNTDAVEIVFSGFSKSSKEMKVRITQWFCFYKTRLYTVTFTAKADSDIHNATAKKIMQSIMFSN